MSTKKRCTRAAEIPLFMPEIRSEERFDVDVPAPVIVTDERQPHPIGDRLSIEEDRHHATNGQVVAKHQHMRKTLTSCR